MTVAVTHTSCEPKPGVKPCSSYVSHLRLEELLLFCQPGLYLLADVSKSPLASFRKSCTNTAVTNHPPLFQGTKTMLLVLVTLQLLLPPVILVRHQI